MAPQAVPQAAPMDPAPLEWRDAQPYNPHFDDIYHHSDGEDEVQRVFVQPSGVLELAHRQARISVTELGFGTGLNFVVTASEVLRGSAASLHFVSFERWPLDAPTWQRLSQERGASLPLYAELARKAPPLLSGWHRRSFAKGRVVLSVFHGDVMDGLADLRERQRCTTDVWYLDGFAPSRNPQMWSEALFAHVAACSHTETRAVTFSAAGSVRRGLASAGFEVESVDQRPFKRESLCARYAGKRDRRAPPDGLRALVHGAGIGGAMMARHLAEQGISTVLHDPHGIANGASAMPLTLLHPRLLGDASTTAEHRAAAFHYSTNLLHGQPGVTVSGALQVAGPNMDEAKMRRIASAYRASTADDTHWLALLSPDRTRALAGVELGDALWFPGAATVRLRALCMHLCEHPNIELVRQATPVPGEHIHIHCNALECRDQAGLEWLELAAVHGQIDTLAERPPRLSVPVVGDGYCIPGAAYTVIGATYEYEPWKPSAASAHNRSRNRHLLSSGSTPVGRYRGTRTVSSDRLPVVGELAADRFIATAHGSLGTSTAPLAAAHVLSLVMGWVPPFSGALQQALAPERFKQRQARRGPPGRRRGKPD